MRGLGPLRDQLLDAHACPGTLEDLAHAFEVHGGEIGAAEQAEEFRTVVRRGTAQRESDQRGRTGPGDVVEV
jgi:hypothetical protein